MYMQPRLTYCSEVKTPAITVLLPAKKINITIAMTPANKRISLVILNAVATTLVLAIHVHCTLDHKGCKSCPFSFLRVTSSKCIANTNTSSCSKAKGNLNMRRGLVGSLSLSLWVDRHTINPGKSSRLLLLNQQSYSNSAWFIARAVDGDYLQAAEVHLRHE